MNRLMIVGNGFDIGHGINSSYDNFKNYLEENYDCSYSGEPEYIMYPDGSEGYKYDSDVCLIRNKITEMEGEKWSAVEETMGYLDFSDFFDDIDFDRDDIFKQGYSNLDLAEILKDSFSNVSEYFTEWIESLDINREEKKEYLCNLFDDNMKILTFNYTDLLENIYGIKEDKILYIHGKAGESEILEFGHGREIEYCGEEGISYVGQDEIDDLSNILKKDTKQLLRKNKYFFEELGNLEEVYSYGFSYGKVDHVYIEEIIKDSTDEKTIWYLQIYEDREGCDKYAKMIADEYAQIIRGLGFKGAFKKFKC